MNVTGTSVVEGYCSICGKPEDVLEHMKDKWVCDDCKTKKQEEFEQELALQNE